MKVLVLCFNFRRQFFGLELRSGRFVGDAVGAAVDAARPAAGTGTGVRRALRRQRIPAPRPPNPSAPFVISGNRSSVAIHTSPSGADSAHNARTLTSDQWSATFLDSFAPPSFPLPLSVFPFSALFSELICVILVDVLTLSGARPRYSQFAVYYCHNTCDK